MFRDLDSRINDWFQQNKECTNLDQELINQAKALAKIDETEPIVEQVWLQKFKKHFKIQQQ